MAARPFLEPCGRLRRAWRDLIRRKAGRPDGRCASEWTICASTEAPDCDALAAGLWQRTILRPARAGGGAGACVHICINSSMAKQCVRKSPAASLPGGSKPATERDHAEDIAWGAVGDIA